MLLSARILNMSAVPPLELAHVSDQRLYAAQSHRVVDRGAHPADGAVPREAYQSCPLGALEEICVELRACQGERHVHPRAAGRVDRVAIQRGTVDRRIDLLRLGAVELL